MRFKKVAIVGLGLIGGSIAKAIKKYHLASSLWGLAHTSLSLNKIKKLSLFDRLTLNLEEAVRGAELVILAVPTLAIREYIVKLSGKLSDKSLVIDVGSVKKPIVKAGSKFLKSKFVGTHPLSGSEKKGINEARADLFKNSLVIIVPSRHKTNTQRAALFWRSLGAKVEFVGAEKHDKIMAFTSHLPHLIAFSLLESLPENFLKYKAGSLRDITRGAASSALLWYDIFSDNFTNIKLAFDRFVKSSRQIMGYVKAADKQRFLKLVERANRKALR